MLQFKDRVCFDASQARPRADSSPTFTDERWLEGECIHFDNGEIEIAVFLEGDGTQHRYFVPRSAIKPLQPGGDCSPNQSVSN